MISFLKKVPKTQLIRCISTTAKQNGYIVLVPEIGEDAATKNGLLTSEGLPEFNNITIEMCMATIGSQATQLEKIVKMVEESVVSQDEVDVFRDIIDHFEEPTVQLETTWGIAKTLYLGNSSLIPTKSYLNIHERAKRARAAKYNSKILYEKIKESESQSGEDSSEKKRLVERYLLEGKLNGLCLKAADKEQLMDVINKLGKERGNFKSKVDISIQQFCRTITDYATVRDFPPELLESVATDPSQPTNGPWKIGLRPYVVSEFLKYCPDRSERWNVWQADARKASGYAEKSLETSSQIEAIRSHRRNQAQLLGFPDFATMSMETKMVKNVQNVIEIIDTLLSHALPSQKEELNKLQEFANSSGFQQELELCDIPYYRRKQIKAEHNFDEVSIKDYFPLPRVLTGLFFLTEKLFKVKIVERENTEAWHENVKFFNVFDAQDSSAPIAGFYLDCYSKENSHANLMGNCGWMVGVRNKSSLAQTTPLSTLVFNFNAPIYGKPCLLSIKDLQMLFKSFGAGMQHMLTRANYSDLAGLSNIEWDASQVSSNVLANFLDDFETYRAISGHYNTDEQISQVQFESIRAYMNHLAGYELCRELYLSHLDLELHTSKDFWLDIVKKLWPKYIALPLDKKDSHPCSMTEIFSGDWAAAYFSNFHSKMIAADIFAAFTEERQKSGNIYDASSRYRDTFLSYGGSMNTAEVFRRFRGRDPSPNALLKSLNLYKNPVINADKS